MGIRMQGLGSGIDPKLIESLVKAEGIPVENAKKRKETITEEKKEFEKIQGLINELESAVGSLKSRTDFYKLKIESSHPDIIEGTAGSNALIGSYELEVRALARADKKLAEGYPDKDQTSVGFGYMEIEREDMDPFEVIVDPGSTLQDVAKKINDARAGVKAMVINTKYQPNPYRLLVISEKSGQEARVTIDEDTTDVTFASQVLGTNLDVLFEDVPVTNDKNALDELLPDVVLNIKRSEPGTRIQVNVTYDLDKSMEQIKNFVEKYNKVSEYINKQFVYDPNTKRAGVLAGESSIKTILRSLQSSLSTMEKNVGKFQNLADIGITTDPKTGQLNFNESKTKQALQEDYDSVAGVFVESDFNQGLGARMATTLKQLKDPMSGPIRSKMKSLDAIIKNQDQDIERRERMLEQKQENIRRKFTSLDNKIAGLKSQGDFLAARLGGGGGGGGAPGGGGAGG